MLPLIPVEYLSFTICSNNALHRPKIQSRDTFSSCVSLVLFNLEQLPFCSSSDPDISEEHRPVCWLLVGTRCFLVVWLFARNPTGVHCALQCITDTHTRTQARTLLYALVAF